MTPCDALAGIGEPDAAEAVVMSRLEQLERMLAEEPDDPFLNFSLAMELARLQRPDESLRQFDRVLELDAGYCTAYFQKISVPTSMPEAAQITITAVSATLSAAFTSPTKSA